MINYRTTLETYFKLQSKQTVHVLCVRRRQRIQVRTDLKQWWWPEGRKSKIRLAHLYLWVQLTVNLHLFFDKTVDGKEFTEAASLMCHWYFPSSTDFDQQCPDNLVTSSAFQKWRQKIQSYTTNLYSTALSHPVPWAGAHSEIADLRSNLIYG